MTRRAAPAMLDADPAGLAPDAPLTLAEAARTLLRDLVTESTLRAAAARGDLATERLGRLTVTTPADIAAWRKKCRDKAEVRISTSKPEKTGTPFGISATEEAERALAAALAIVKGLGKPSNATLREPPARISGRVIPLRSESRT